MQSSGSCEVQLPLPVAQPSLQSLGKQLIPATPTGLCPLGQVDLLEALEKVILETELDFCAGLLCHAP